MAILLITVAKHHEKIAQETTHMNEDPVLCVFRPLVIGIAECLPEFGSMGSLPVLMASAPTSFPSITDLNTTNESECVDSSKVSIHTFHIMTPKMAFRAGFVLYSSMRSSNSLSFAW